MPPGSAKSKFCSWLFPSWYVGRNPTKNIISASYAAALAERFGKKVRNTVDSLEFEEIFGVKLSQDSQAKGDWTTTEGGEYYAVGVDGGVTGRRTDLGIVDDPVKGRKEADSETTQENTWQWFLTEFDTRLKPDAARIIIQTRWNENDLSGKILPDDWNGESGWFESKSLFEADGSPEKWYVLCFPGEARENDILGRKVGEVLWPEYLGSTIKKKINTLSPRDVSSLIQQMPTAEDGTFFKREWFKRFEPIDRPRNLDYYIVSDYAVTEDAGDFTEHVVVGIDPIGDIWIVSGWYGQEESDTWIDELIKLILRFKPFTCFGEKGQIRRAIEPFLKKEMIKQNAFCRREWFNRSHKKEITARAFQGLASMGKVHIVNNAYGERGLNQLLKFPGGKFDDFVDAVALIGVALEEMPDAMVSEEKPTDPNDIWGDPWADENEETIWEND